MREKRYLFARATRKLKRGTKNSQSDTDNNSESDFASATSSNITDFFDGFDIGMFKNGSLMPYNPKRYDAIRKLCDQHRRFLVAGQGRIAVRDAAISGSDRADAVAAVWEAFDKISKWSGLASKAIAQTATEATETPRKRTNKR
jgi:hypothetical protein